jgi:hypothetical protein
LIFFFIKKEKENEKEKEGIFSKIIVGGHSVFYQLMSNHVLKVTT